MILIRRYANGGKYPNELSNKLTTREYHCKLKLFFSSYITPSPFDRSQVSFSERDLSTIDAVISSRANRVERRANRTVVNIYGAGRTLFRVSRAPFRAQARPTRVEH